jgi:phage gpG-like protein
MSGVAATLEIDASPLHGVLSGLRAVTENLNEPLDAIGAVLVANTMTRFETGKGPGGIAWLPSIAAKLRGGQTLVETGRLRSSFTSQVVGDSVEWGTNVVYAAVHQFGHSFSHQAFRAAERKGFGLPFAESIVTLPARPFIGVDDNDVADMKEVLVDFLGRMAGVNPQSGGAE